MAHINFQIYLRRAVYLWLGRHTWLKKEGNIGLCFYGWAGKVESNSNSYSPTSDVAEYRVCAQSWIYILVFPLGTLFKNFKHWGSCRQPCFWQKDQSLGQFEMNGTVREVMFWRHIKVCKQLFLVFPHLSNGTPKYNKSTYGASQRCKTML